MDKYHTLEKLGSGTFGVVWKAFNKQTNELVAIKKLLTKYESSRNKIMIRREVKSLVFNSHENIVKLKEIINEHNVIFLVFEYMQGSLYDHMVYRSKLGPFSEAEVRRVCFQIFKGLACMHSNGYIHRDLKPANVLVSNGLVKIGDLGSAREIDDELPMTHIVTTRWYRAPEVFLHSEVYDSAVDMWAMGAIMAELFTFRPLFRGSSDAHVMHMICSVLGTPTQSLWLEGLELARNMNYRFPNVPGVRFSNLLPMASSEAINLISSLLSWSPNARPTAMEALQHPFFRGCHQLEYADPSSPLVFELAELMEKKSSSESGGDAHANDDIIRMLPEYPFEFMRENKCESVSN